ncbi:MAG: MFS transporter [Candidatus Velthaea sp.]
MATYADAVAVEPNTDTFESWRIVGVAALGLFLSLGTIVVLSFGVYVKPLSADFHASRTAISLAFTIQSIVTALCVPLVGRLIDRLGARIVIIVGTALFGLVLVSSELVGNTIASLYILYAMLGIIGSTTSPVPYGVIVSRWFDARRGLALGFMACGLGLGAIFIPIFSQRLIAMFGWRHSYAGFGVATLALVLPVIALFLRQSPRSAPSLGTETPVTAPMMDADSNGLPWDEIRRKPAFWFMIFAYFLASASLVGCVVHLPAMIVDRGGNAADVAGVSSAIGVALLIGRFGTGVLLDRIFGPRLAMLVFGGAGVGICILFAGFTGLPVLVAAFLLGLATGAEIDMIAFLMGRYFGLRALGTAFAFGFASYVLAGALGVYLMGAGFDATHAYTLPLAGLAASMFLAIVLIGRLGPYRYAAPAAARESRTLNALSSEVP